MPPRAALWGALFASLVMTATAAPAPAPSAAPKPTAAAAVASTAAPKPALAPSAAAPKPTAAAVAATAAPKPAAPPPATVETASAPQRRYNPAFPASSPDLVAADEAQAAAAAAAARPRVAATAKPAAGARDTWPDGTSAAVKAALPIGTDGTIVPLAEPKATAVVVPPKGSIYWTGGEIRMADVPANAVATGATSTAADPVPGGVATGGRK